MIHRVSGLVMPETVNECLATNCDNCALEYGGFQCGPVAHMCSHCILVDSVIA